MGFAYWCLTFTWDKQQVVRDVKDNPTTVVSTTKFSLILVIFITAFDVNARVVGFILVLTNKIRKRTEEFGVYEGRGDEG